MKLSRIFAAVALAGALIAGGAAPAYAVTKKATKKVAKKGTTKKRAVSNHYTSIPAFTKACELKAYPNDCSWGNRKVTACWSNTKYLERPYCDERCCGAISLSGNLSNPDYLIENRDGTYVFIGAKSGLVEYMIPDPEVILSRGGNVGFSGSAQKIVDFSPSGVPEEFEFIFN